MKTTFRFHPLFCLLSYLACAASLPAADPLVSAVRAAQRPDDKRVDIWYDVADADGDRLTVSVAVTVGGVNYAAPSLSGDVGARVIPGRNRRIVWDAGTDWDGRLLSNVCFTVTADDGTAPGGGTFDPGGSDPILSPAGDYLVIDLSDGPSATEYPVTFLSSAPSGGWSEAYKTTKLALRRIPAGTFVMGAPGDELGTSSYIDETQHPVTLSRDFYIGVFEVTQKQWERVVGTWPSYFLNPTCRDSRPVENIGFFEIREGSTSASYPTWPHSIRVPTDSFIGRLRRRTSLATLDMPTESQWEYACRAGTTTALNSGKNLTESGWYCLNLAELARYGGNSSANWSTQNSDTSEATATVGSYLPNAWGLYDMHGNVAEMCLDWFGDYPATVTDPAGPEFGVSGPVFGISKVTRGGTYHSTTDNCRSASRDADVPSGRSYRAGFRLAVTTYARVPPPGGVSSPPAGMAFIPKGTNLGMDPDFGPYVLPLESSFFMDTCEVSKALWDEVYAWAVNHGYGFDRTAAGKAPNHPAQKMHWYDAVKWCNARSEKAGLDPAYYTDADCTQVYRIENLDAPFVKASASGYRLPTEKQWRYAARGGVEGRRFPWGDSDEIQHARANYVSSPPLGGSTRPDYDTSPSLGYHPVYATGDYPYTSPVGSFAPNGYGLYDMAGNVAEWCFDRVPWQPTNYRYVRGGGYGDPADRCRTAEMAYSWPEPSQFNEGTGFRTVLPIGYSSTP